MVRGDCMIVKYNSNRKYKDDELLKSALRTSKSTNKGIMYNSVIDKNPHDNFKLEPINNLPSISNPIKGVSSGTPSSMPKVSPVESLPKVTVSQRAGLAAEKSSRYYLQNSPDMYNSTPKQIGPKQWAGPANTAALRVAPGSSDVKKAVAANNRANTAYLKYAAEAYVPESLPKVGDTPIGPQQLPSVGNLTPYTPNTKPVKELSFKEKFMQKGLNPSETWANSSMELPAVPTAAKQGGGLGNRGYNAVSSIGDNMIGADKSLKATAKQSAANETAYRNALMSYNETIDAIMLARDRYPSTSDEYKKYSMALDKIYAAADSLRDKAADMTDANEFMASAEQLRREATKGLSGLPLQFAEAAISVGDNLATMGMTGFNPTATLIMMGAKAAGQRANELSNQGVSAGDAFSRGVLSGIIEGVTEKIGLDNLLDIVSSNNVKALSSILKQMVAEGGEEGLSSIMNYAADRMSGDNKDFDWDDFSQSIIQGALSGLIFGAGGTVTNKVMPMVTNYLDNALPVVSGYSDMQHLNMARELEGKKLGNVIPNASIYSSDTANTGVNIGNMSAADHLNVANKPNLDGGPFNSRPYYDIRDFVDYDVNKTQNTRQNNLVDINTSGIETKVFDNSDPTNLLTDTDVRAFNFVVKTAEQKNLSPQKLYNAYKKERNKLFNKTVNDIFEVYKNYKPQGTQLINTTENMGSGTVDRLQRISNNEAWYSEAFKEYGHKPNQTQLKAFLEKKVNADIRNGGGEYIDANTAKKLKTFDSLLNGYERITYNGTRNVQDIRLNESGNFEVDYNNAKNGLEQANSLSKKERANDSASIISKLHDNIINLKDMQPVSTLTGNEFQKGNERITDTVGRFFASLGNKVKRIGFGDITIDVDGVKDSIAHGLGKRKAAAFKAIPDVLVNGKQIDYQSEWKGRTYDTYVFAAPIQVEDEINYVAAVVTNSGSANRYYLHEVVDQNGNIIYSKNKSNGNNDSSAIGFKTTSIGANNNPLLNNIVPNSEQKSNSIGNNNLGIVNQDAQQLFETVQEAKSGVKGKLQRGYQSFVSGLAPFERMAKADTRETGRNISALANKHGQKGGIVDTILTRGLYDINGNKVSDLSFVQVASQVPKEQLAAFNDYWHEKHNIDRQAQGKPVTAHTAEESRQIVAKYEKQHPKFITYQQNISNYLDTFMRTWLVGSGLMSEADYFNMKKMYPYYVPTFRVDDGIPGGGSVKSGKKIRGSNAVGKAKGGTSDILSFDEAITQKINSVITAATKNDISREILSFAQTLPAEAAKSGILIDTDTSGQYAGQIDLGEFMDNVDKNIARQISKGNYEITFYNDGKPQTMKISRDVWEAYNFLDSKLGDASGYKIAAAIGRTFTNPMRALTTTYNPLFFMTNLMRDMQTYTINNTAKNSAVAAKNYVKALVEIAKRSDTYNQYKALGGSQNGYYGSNMYQKAETNVNPGAKTYGQKALGVIKSPLTAIEMAGEFTEKIPRYAEYLNTIDRLGNTDTGRLQASLNAADVTVNFNRSSTLSTLANAWVPYFNAGLQGVDKTFRQIKAHPVQTTARAAVSVFLPTLLFYLVNKDNPHWEDVKDGVRDNYYLIPNTFGPHDEEGNAETFIRLPKSREFGAIFSASFERFIRAINESEENGDSLNNTMPSAFDGYLETLLNSVAPPDILGDNIAGSLIRLGTNTAWHGGKIVPSNLEKNSPRNQYDINTSGIAMGIANAAQSLPVAPGWLESPMKVDYLIDSYGGYAGGLIQGLTSRKNVGSNAKETLMNSLNTGFVQPFKNRLTTDSAYSNYNIDRLYDKTEELETVANDKSIDENLPNNFKTEEDVVISAITKAKSEMASITKQEKQILNSPMSITEKNDKIRELRQKKNVMAKKALDDIDKIRASYSAAYDPAKRALGYLLEFNSLTDEGQGEVLSGLSEYAAETAKNSIYPDYKLSNSITEAQSNPSKYYLDKYKEDNFLVEELGDIPYDRKEEAYKLNTTYGLPYSDFIEDYNAYKRIYNTDVGATKKATEFDKYLDSRGYIDGTPLRNDLEDIFVYYNMSPANSYYDTKGWNEVKNILDDVDQYENLIQSTQVTAGVDYQKGVSGAKSRAIADKIDDWIEYYGLNLTPEEIRNLKIARGVGKNYAY